MITLIFLKKKCNHQSRLKACQSDVRKTIFVFRFQSSFSLGTTAHS